MIFPILHGYQPVDTPEKEVAYNMALYALNMKQNNPGSKLWRMRVKQALQRLEGLYGVVLRTVS